MKLKYIIILLIVLLIVLISNELVRIQTTNLYLKNNINHNNHNNHNNNDDNISVRNLIPKIFNKDNIGIINKTT